MRWNSGDVSPVYCAIGISMANKVVEDDDSLTYRMLGNIFRSKKTQQLTQLVVK